METNFNSVKNYVFQPSSEIVTANPEAVVDFNAGLDINCRTAAIEISEWLDTIDYSSIHPIDPSNFIQQLTAIVKRNLEGNLNYARQIREISV